MVDRRVFVPLGDALAMTFRDGREVSSCQPGPRTVPAGGTLLRYPPTKPQTNVTFQGGAIAPGVPVQLLFWGDWWNNAGAPQRDVLIGAVQTLLAGPYTRALDQYGIVPPTFGGWRVIGGAPAGFVWSDIQGFVQGLIDNGTFPEPDEAGGRNAYFVMLPSGSVDKSGKNECGAHGQNIETDLLGLDPDHAWIAFIDYNSDTNAMTSCFSHELAELTTDPEQNAWFVQGVPGDSAEIGDVCDVQENWVGGVKVRAYWSKRDGVCVIPTDAAYSVCIAGSVDQTDRTAIKEGTTPGSRSSGALGALVPACDLSRVDFKYTIYQDQETAFLTATETGYHAPVYAWSVGGHALADGSGTVTIRPSVTYLEPAGVARVSTDLVTLSYVAAGPRLQLTNDSVVGLFDVIVGVTVDEDPTQSKPATNGSRTSSLAVSYVGEDIEQPDYDRAVEACAEAALEFWKKTHPAEEPKPGPVDPGPIHERDLARFYSLPGWVTSDQREAARRAIVEAARLRSAEREAGDELQALLLASIGLAREG